MWFKSPHSFLHLIQLLLLAQIIQICTYHQAGALGSGDEENSAAAAQTNAEPTKFIFVEKGVEVDSEAEVEVSEENESKVPMLTISVQEPPPRLNDTNAVANVYDDGTTEVTFNNGTEVASNVTTKGPVNMTAACLQRELAYALDGSLILPSVEIVNTTVLHGDVLWMNASIKTRSTPSNCSIVLFFADWCPFSAKAAPHFNALAKAFPHIRVVAIDSTIHSSVNSFFGILSVPTILLFHNGKTVAKFNETIFTLSKFAEFVHAFTDMRSDENINVTSQDFLGPLSSTPTETHDIWLYVAWIFIVVCFFHYASKSTLWRRVSELVRTTWREAEAQHEHTD